MDQANSDHCRAFVRQFDRDRYLSALFAPEAHRDALLALYAFDVEINRIPDLVSGPMPGEIRLQWWADALNDIEHGSIAANPVAAALRAAIETYQLPAKPLLDLVEAHVFDLYNDPMPTLTDLEGYSGETVSAILQLSAIVLAGGGDPGTADVSGHAGAAIGLTKVLRTFGSRCAKGQVFLPADLLARHGLTPQDVLAPGRHESLRAALSEMGAHVRHHLDRFSAAFALAEAQPVAAAFLQIGTIPAYLKALEKLQGDPRSQSAQVPQWRRQWDLWRTARRLSR